MQCWTLLLLLLEPQAADGLLTQLSVCWCICGSVCLVRPASVWDTSSAVIQVSVVASSLSGGQAVRRESTGREWRKIRELSCGFRPDEGRRDGRGHPAKNKPVQVRDNTNKGPVR